MGFLRTLALASLAVSTALADGLNARAAALGKYMGIEYGLSELNDPRFTRVVNNRGDFGFHAPAEVMKWDATEPQRNLFTFPHADRVVEMARATGMKLHCGPLVWHSQLPSWVAQSGFDNATLTSVVRDHVTAVVARHRGACARWDVVREALAEDGGLRSSVFSRTTGAAFVPVAFAAAAAADPDAALFYADYHLEADAATGDAKAAGARRLVDLVRRHGARVDGVALEARYGSGRVPALAAAVRPFADLGLDVVFAPLEIPGGDAQQAVDYATVVAACAGAQRCLGVSLGKLADLFYLTLGNYQRKPTYTAILDAWGAAPAA